VSALERIAELHVPEDEEAEFWYGDDGHDERFPDCTSEAGCDGHIVTVQVCAECGYEHDGDRATFRAWPCPTRRLCDEAAKHHAEWGCNECGEAFKRGAEAGRDHASDECVMAEMAARADADRLAAAMRAAMAGKPHTKFSELLAAHDAARTKEGL